MTTDFSYGGKQILSNGPFKPNGKDMPSDARTRVDCYADIATIPNPYVGLKITVKVDETNNNKMTDYIVKSLKANAIGVANSLIDEVVRYVDYLGVNTSGSSGEGLTSEQANNIAKIPAIKATVDALPNNYASKNYTVTKDNGIGGKMAFDEDAAGANGVDITINNVACKLYGEILLSQGQYFIYID